MNRLSLSEVFNCIMHLEVKAEYHPYKVSPPLDDEHWAERHNRFVAIEHQMWVLVKQLALPYVNDLWNPETWYLVPIEIQAIIIQVQADRNYYMHRYYNR